MAEGGLTTDSVQVTVRPDPQPEIDKWADFFFYQLHPTLKSRKIRPDETQYVNEWKSIQAVMRESLVYKQSCNDRFEWQLLNYDNQGIRRPLSSPVLDRVADAVFYTRHPELDYRKIQSTERELASEWLQIRQTVSILDPCD